MRKLSMARAGKGGGGSKKVSPPSVPGAPILYTGHQNASDVYGGYETMSIYEETVNEYSLDKSYESTHSEGIYSTAEPIYRRIQPKSLRTFSSESAVQRPNTFKEPFPIHRAGSTSTPSPATPSELSPAPSYTPSSEMSPAPRGSRNSVNSVDSGWASAPLANPVYGTRASNSSLNSDKTSNSVEETYQRLQTTKQQRRLSSISSSGSIGLNSTFTYGSNPTPSASSFNPLSSSSSSSFNPLISSSASSFNAIGQRQDPSRQSLRTFGSNESVGSQGSKQNSIYSRGSSVCSSTSSSSLFRGGDGVSSLDYRTMILQGVGWEEVMNCWLSMLRFSEYYTLFVTAGYDLQTVTRITPEDLTAIGIKKPNHRKKLKTAADELDVGDGLPDFVPGTVDQFLEVTRLQDYRQILLNQGYHKVSDLLTISIEDLEDIGFYRLGHQKRLLLAIKKVKELKKLGQTATSSGPQFNLGPHGGQGHPHGGQGHPHGGQGHPHGGSRSHAPGGQNGHHQGHNGHPHPQGGQNGHPRPQGGQNGHPHPQGGAAIHRHSQGSLHYYPEEVSFQSLPPLPSNRLSSFHQEPLVHIREGEVYEGFRGREGETGGMMPTPMPPIEASYKSPQRFERCQSEESRPSVWQRFKSFEESDAVRRNTVAGERPSGFGQFVSGTLPRPRATVKPLPVPDTTKSAAEDELKGSASSKGEHSALSEIRKPDFSSHEEEGLCSGPDLLLPFANDRAGTIKYKTNPATAYNQFQDEENEETSLPLPGTPQNYTANPSQPFNFPTPPTPLHLPPTPHNQQLTSSPQLSSTSNQQLTSPPQLSSTSNQQLLDTSGGDGQNLLRTPTRNPNRSAGDVLMDIGTMLADLTDELDTMLQLDKN